MPRGPRRRHSASVSRLKALLSLVEDFGRLTLANAGLTSAKWKHVVAGWTIAAGKGTSVALGSLISTTFSSTNATIKAKNPASGVGPAFWVTDSGNYWAVVKNTTNICQTCSACGQYNSCSYCSSYAYGSNASCGCASYTQTTCCNQYNYGPDGSCGCASYTTTSCCNGYGTCTVCSSYGTQTCCVAYSNYECCIASVPFYYTCCTGYTTSSCCTEYYTYYGNFCCAAYVYNSYKGGVVCGQPTFCAVTLCFSYGTCTTCSSYSECSGSYCAVYGSCQQCVAYGSCTVCTGYSQQSCCTSYTSCTVCAANNSCQYCTGYTSCTVCGAYNQCQYCDGYSYGPNASCGCASSYTYNCNCADHHKIDLIKKEGGSETVISSTSNSTTAIAGIKVTTDGNSVTAQAYSDVNYSSQVGSDLTTTNAGQKSKDHGIISRASNASQGYTIDEFRVN